MPHFSKNGNDEYMCQQCGRIYEANETNRPTWIQGLGNVCPNCTKFGALVNAIRTHEKVGRGTCTTIDECYSDEELRTVLEEDEVKSTEDVIRWALEIEGIRIEQSLNYH